MMTEVVEKWSVRGGGHSVGGSGFFILRRDRFRSLLKRCLCVNQIYLL